MKDHIQYTVLYLQKRLYILLDILVWSDSAVLISHLLYRLWGYNGNKMPHAVDVCCCTVNSLDKNIISVDSQAKPYQISPSPYPIFD
jgi:hypothetical protein